ncbi:MAG: DegV family protein [Tissierellales bacterium]|nr:DegV family protein [Tissierellales bacterium]
MTVKIITDSTAYLSKEYVEKEDITVVPLHYMFDGVEYIEGFKGEFDDYFEKLQNSKSFPTTSQPSVGEFKEAYLKALENYDEIIVIVLSSKLSGTYNSAVAAKELLEDKKITIVDTLSTVAALKFLIEDAVMLKKEGKNADEIASYLEDKKTKLKVLALPDTLEYLKRGGRISPLQANLGNLINIKPIIELKDGELTLLEKARGKKNALDRVIELVGDEINRATICQILAYDEALVFKELLEEKHPDLNIKIDIEEIGPVIGSHLGPKTIGICWY